MNISAAKATLQSLQVVISEAYLISYPDDVDRIAEDIATAKFFEGFLPPETNAMEPVSDILYPIIEDAYQNIKIMQGDGEEDASSSHKIVGIFSLSVYWRDKIRNILPEGSNGLRVVFTNPCNPTFTYQINGPEVVFLGALDSHEEQYDDMEISSPLTDLGAYAIEESFYSGLAINEEFCPFTIHVYPSDEMKAVYTTNTPVVFGLVTAAVFIVTTLTFVLYDFCVERRQKVVMKTAVASSAIVSSLFPESVREQIMTTQEEGLEQPQRRLNAFLNDGKKDDIIDPQNNDSRFITSRFNITSRSILTGSRNNKSSRFLLDGSSHSRLSGSDGDNSKPIAELFPETTVCFCDIAGFTAWSSVREPSHVFSLLEALYGAFDKIARNLGVFKVETIGDSYVSLLLSKRKAILSAMELEYLTTFSCFLFSQVAVCGLPKPRSNHAVAMARFASKCMDQMRIVTRELELTLGPDTGDLSWRIGLHSGPTIAGVLRGERARFQLFGDTVGSRANTMKL